MTAAILAVAVIGLFLGLRRLFSEDDQNGYYQHANGKGGRLD